MGTGEAPILATFATDWSVPKHRYRGDAEAVRAELARFGLRHAGDWLRDGIFSFEMKPHPELVIQMNSPEEALLPLLVGAWKPLENYGVGKFVGDPLTPSFTPLEVGEALSAQPLLKLELRHICRGNESFDKAAGIHREALQAWMKSYVYSLGISPTQRPALEARAWAVTEHNREARKLKIGEGQAIELITPEQLRNVVGPRVFEILRESGRLKF